MLRLSIEKRHIDVSGTATFIKKVVTWWTNLNVKKKGMDLRNRQTLQAVISDPQDSRLSLIQDFGEMCLKMSGARGKREKQLSKDTASAIHHLSKALVELTKHLLTEEGFDYVCLAEFSTDRL